MNVRYNLVSILLCLVALCASTAAFASPTKARRPSASAAAARDKTGGKCRVVQGYRLGHPEPVTIAVVDGKPMECVTALRYLRMKRAAAADGLNLLVLSGWRSMQRQSQLYRSPHSAPVARPGFSRHQSGHALDLNAGTPGVHPWLVKNAWRWGFLPFQPERWHWYRDPSKPATAEELRSAQRWCATGILPSW